MKATTYFWIAIPLMVCGMAMAATLENLIDVEVPTYIDGTRPSSDDVRDAILAGCKRKTWIPVADENGKITCSITVRARHFAEVEIPYTADKYSILYKDSRELDYDEKKQRIHRNYNKWVILLFEAIQQQFVK